MKYLFMDNSEVSNKQMSVNSLGGFIIEASDYAKLSEEFRSLKEEFGLSRSDCVKWSPGSTDKRYEKFRALKNINEFRRRALALFVKYDIQILCCIINNNLEAMRIAKSKNQISKSKMKEYVTDYNKRSLEYAAQRFQRHLKEHDVHGQIIVEFNNDIKLNSALGQHYRKIRTYGSGGPHFDLKLENLSDCLLFSHDFCCDGIEMADFIVSSMTTSLRTRRYEYVDILKPRVRKKYGQSKGYGIVVYPSNSPIADNLIRRVNAN